MISNSKKLSIIIVNYRKKDLTAACLESIGANPPPCEYEVIVVDNNSQDGSAEFLQSIGRADVHILEAPWNGGFSYGNNLGYGHSLGEYLFFLNNDTELMPAVLGNMISFLEENKGFGALTSLSIDGSGYFLNNGHSFPNWTTQLKEIYGRRLVPEKMRAFHRRKKATSGTSDATRFDWISGSGFLVSAELFEAVGQWDEGYFMYMEDVALCQEIARAGKACGVFNQIGFRHYVGSGADSAKVILETVRSEIRYYREYRPDQSKKTSQLAIARARQKAKYLSPSDALLLMQQLAEIEI